MSDIKLNITNGEINETLIKLNMVNDGFVEHQIKLNYAKPATTIKLNMVNGGFVETVIKLNFIYVPEPVSGEIFDYVFDFLVR